MAIFVTILAIGVLMGVHEGGHFLLARIFKMRVLKFSIGFGPVLWSHKPEKSETTYQVALLPFLAYVQIAGMNPHEEVEADDKGSYANASWLGRVLTIFAGPLANYLFAAIVFFFLLVLAGPESIDGLKVGEVRRDSPAMVAHVQLGDEVKSIGGTAVHTWPEMAAAIGAHKGVATEVVVARKGQTVALTITPSKEEGKIGIGASFVRRPTSVAEAARGALIIPPRAVIGNLVGLGRLITGKEKFDPKGPIGIVGEVSDQLRHGPAHWIEVIAGLSIYLCVFNLLPYPALDGGRMMFLLYEFIARKRPDAKVEARVHLVGMLTLLTLMIPLFFFEIWRSVAKLFLKG